jgi:hypothetical protein
VAPGAAQIVIGTGFEGDGAVLAAGQITQVASNVIDIVVLDTPAVSSLQAIVLYTLLPILLIGAGLASLQSRSRIR